MTRDGALARLPLLALLFAAACDAGPCFAEGQTYSARDEAAACCPGLVSVDGLGPVEGPTEPLSGMPEGCGRDAPPDVKQCLPCGDGTCDPDEDFCNCPADCVRP